MSFGTPMLYFEDFEVGKAESYGSTRVTEAAMLEFAREFDPQPMHLDGASEQAERMGGLIASGWLTCALNMRMMTDHFILNSAGMGSPGVSSLKWNAPVRAGDTLSGRMTVLDKRASATRPDRGFIQFRFELENQHGQRVLEQVNLIMYQRRTPGARLAEAPRSTIGKPADEAFSTAATATRLGLIDDIRPGTVLEYGSYDFTPENMLRYARRFDPQAFHLSEEAGKASHFGGLSASGWHTAAAWMATSIRYWQQRAAEQPLPKRGPGLGFVDLIWRRPVLAGDRLTFRSRVVDARRSASRPGWGILTQRNYAHNQHGLPVFAFTISALWEARA